MSDLIFLTLDDVAAPAGDAAPGTRGAAWTPAAAPFADDPAFEPSAEADAVAALAHTRDGCAAARAADWVTAAERLGASARRRDALVRRGAAGPAVAARGWSDVAAVAAARDDAPGAADALARARAVAPDPAALPADVAAALDDVATWLAALGGAAAGPPAPGIDVGPFAPDAFAPDAFADAFADLTADLAADFATALVIEPLTAESLIIEPPTEDPGFTEILLAEPRTVDHTVDAPTSDALSATRLPANSVPGDALPSDAGAGHTAAEEEDALVFLAVDDAPSAAPPAGRQTGPGLSWLELEGPVRDWERSAPGVSCAVVPASLASPAQGAATARAPLAGPLAPALRNAKIDEAVALATAPPAASPPGRLQALLGRFRRG
jgi:hypothetical protein